MMQSDQKETYHVLLCSFMYICICVLGCMYIYTYVYMCMFKVGILHGVKFM